MEGGGCYYPYRGLIMSVKIAGNETIQIGRDDALKPQHGETGIIVIHCSPRQVIMLHVNI